MEKRLAAFGGNLFVGGLPGRGTGVYGCSDKCSCNYFGLYTAADRPSNGSEYANPYRSVNSATNSYRYPNSYQYADSYTNTGAAGYYDLLRRRHFFGG